MAKCQFILDVRNQVTLPVSIIVQLIMYMSFTVLIAIVIGSKYDLNIQVLRDINSKYAKPEKGNVWMEHCYKLYNRKNGRES